MPNEKRHPKPIVCFHGKKRQQKWLINRFQTQKVVFLDYEYTFQSQGLKRPNIVSRERQHEKETTKKLHHRIPTYYTNLRVFFIRRKWHQTLAVNEDYDIHEMETTIKTRTLKNFPNTFKNNKRHKISCRQFKMNDTIKMKRQQTWHHILFSCLSKRVLNCQRHQTPAVYS